MPEWWVDVAVPLVAFVTLLAMWVALPAPEGEDDLGSKIRKRFKKR